LSGNRFDGEVIVDEACGAAMNGQQLRLDLDSPLRGAVQNDRTMMLWSLFALSKEVVTHLPIYDDGCVRIEVTGGSKGVATMFDKDLLIYICSIIREKVERGENPEAQVTFTVHDFLQIAGSGCGGRDYNRLLSSLDRLQSTQIKTNIETGGEGEDSAFSWILSYKVQYTRRRDGEKAMRALTVKICDWLYRAIVRDGRMLTYAPEYFELPPLERRLFEIARAHCADGEPTRISLDLLRMRVGSQSPLKLFRHKLATRSNVIPDYSFTLFQPQTAAGGRPSRSLKDVVVVIHPAHIKDLPPLSEIREVSPGNEVEWEGAA
jgi:plasmid replication initiation protein